MLLFIVRDILRFAIARMGDEIVVAEIVLFCTNAQPNTRPKLGKALYGTMSASMLFWKHLSGHLLGDEFVPNPYDSCVMNKTANGTQCTVLWHVDDLKILHVVSSECETMVDLLTKRCGNETPVTVSRGDLHDNWV